MASSGVIQIIIVNWHCNNWTCDKYKSSENNKTLVLIAIPQLLKIQILNNSNNFQKLIILSLLKTMFFKGVKHCPILKDLKIG